MTRVDPDQIRSLVNEGAKWTDIFTAILNDAGSDSRMYLFNSLLHHFVVEVETLSIIGGWDRWEDGGYDSETLDAKLEGSFESGVHELTAKV